jgi:hypothetical protein
VYGPGYFVEVLPGVVFASSGAEGFRWPAVFSGVVDLTAVCPGPAVEGSSPRGPEGSTAADELGSELGGGVLSALIVGGFLSGEFVADIWHLIGNDQGCGPVSSGASSIRVGWKLLGCLQALARERFDKRLL